MEDLYFPDLTLYAASIALHNSDASPTEVITILSQRLVEERHAIDLSQYADYFSAGTHTVKNILVCDLINNYHLSLSGIDGGYMDAKKTKRNADEMCFSACFPFVEKTPFSLVCDLLSIHFPEFIYEYTSILADPKKWEPYKLSTFRPIDRFRNRYGLLAQLMPLDMDMALYAEDETILNNPNASKKACCVKSAEQIEKDHEDLYTSYMNRFRDYILLQTFVMAYISQPQKYGSLGVFDAFCRTNQILENNALCLTPLTVTTKIKQHNLLRSVAEQPESDYSEAIKFLPLSTQSEEQYTILASTPSLLLARMIGILVENHFPIKRCKKCGQWFVAFDDLTTNYCLRKDNSGNTCRDIATMKQKTEKQEIRIIQRAIKNTYDRLFNYCRYHPEDQTAKEHLDLFKTRKKELKTAYKDGTMSAQQIKDELIKW